LNAVHTPVVDRLEHGGRVLDHVPFEDAVASPCDCAVVATDHRVFDFGRIAAMPLVVGTRNALKAFARPGIFSL
jgi:hypothetical protein